MTDDIEDFSHEAVIERVKNTPSTWTPERAAVYKRLRDAARAERGEEPIGEHQEPAGSDQD